MAECINKAEVLKEIERFSTEEGSDAVCTLLYCNAISMPTIDIVHCRECLYEDYGMCSHSDHEWERHEEDYYCADGARKPARKSALKHADRETLQSAT